MNFIYYYRNFFKNNPIIILYYLYILFIMKKEEIKPFLNKSFAKEECSIEHNKSLSYDICKV